jgi:ElaB/YqjD/DUF883 family membrane-anchored ribosome-binding protein
MHTSKDLILAAEDLLRSTASYSGAEIEAARGKLKRQMQSLKDQASRGAKLSAQRIEQAAKDTQRYARQHPWQSVAAIALLGIAVGACLYGAQRSANTKSQRLRRSWISR